MHRRFLALIALVFAGAILFGLTQSIASAAPTQQETPAVPGASVDAAVAISPAVALSPTVRIQIHQQIPFTATLAELLPAAMVTAPALAEEAAITGTVALTDAAAITNAAALTDAVVTSGAVTEELAQAITTTLTTTPAMEAGQVITFVLDMKLDFIVSQTMSMTVPATLTVMTADGMTNTISGGLPISLALAVSPTARVTVTPLALTPTVTPTATEIVTAPAAITATEAVTAPAAVTATAAITEEAGVTETIAEGTGGPLELQATTAVTANVRTGPGTDFEVAATLPPATPLQIEAVNETGDWYLLSSAAWIFSTLVNNPPADAPVATPAIIEAVTAAAEAAPAPGPAIAPTATVTTEVTTTVAPPPETPVTEPAADEATAPTVTVDANLRAGPGTAFEVVGGTITGQELNIIGQNAAGDWYLLDNGGWVFANLVANPPADVPVVADDATAASLETSLGATPAPQTAPTGGLSLPTPTPAPPAAEDAAEESAASPSAIELGLEERVYIDQVNNIVARYGTTATTVEDLLSRAAANEALLEDETWQGQVNTAIQVLRRTGAEIRNIDTPPLFAAAQIDLVSAAGSFDQAATLLAQGLTDGALATVGQGVAEFEVGRSLLTQAQAQLGDEGP